MRAHQDRSCIMHAQDRHVDAKRRKGSLQRAGGIINAAARESQSGLLYEPRAALSRAGGSSTIPMRHPPRDRRVPRYFDRMGMTALSFSSGGGTGAQGKKPEGNARTRILPLAR